MWTLNGDHITGTTFLYKIVPSVNILNFIESISNVQYVIKTTTNSCSIYLWSTHSLFLEGYLTHLSESFMNLDFFPDTIIGIASHICITYVFIHVHHLCFQICPFTASLWNYNIFISDSSEISFCRKTYMIFNFTNFFSECNDCLIDWLIDSLIDLWLIFQVIKAYLSFILGAWFYQGLQHNLFMLFYLPCLLNFSSMNMCIYNN